MLNQSQENTSHFCIDALWVIPKFFQLWSASTAKELWNCIKSLKMKFLGKFNNGEHINSQNCEPK